MASAPQMVTKSWTWGRLEMEEAWALPDQVDRLNSSHPVSYKSPEIQNALQSVAMDPVFLGVCWVTSSKQPYLSTSVQLSERDPVLGCFAGKIQ